MTSSKSRQFLKILYTNVDQFVNKRDELLNMISDDVPDIIFVTEVIPKAQVNPIPLSLISLPDFTLYTNFDCDAHNLGQSGFRGISIFISDSL